MKDHLILPVIGMIFGVIGFTLQMTLSDLSIAAPENFITPVAIFTVSLVGFIRMKRRIKIWSI